MQGGFCGSTSASPITTAASLSTRQLSSCFANKGWPAPPCSAGVEGFGASNVLHKPHALHLSADYPIVIEVADSEEKIGEILPMLDEMIADGLITSERVEIVAYRAAPAELIGRRLFVILA